MPRQQPKCPALDLHGVIFDLADFERLSLGIDTSQKIIMFVNALNEDGNLS